MPGIEIEIERYDYTQEIDPKEWVDKVVETFKLCEIPVDEKGASYLKVLIEPKIWEKLSKPTKEDVRGYGEALIKLKYNEDYFSKLFEQATKLTVGQCSDVREYFGQKKENL